jgi:hypothetical protein
VAPGCGLIRGLGATGGTYKAELHDALGNDEHVVALVRETGERQGRRLDQNSVHLYHVVDGKVTETWFTRRSIQG